MPAQPCYESAAMRQPALVTTGDTNRFIERLPRAMDALPPYALVRCGDGPLWQVSLTLAPADQAMLQALRPSAYDLCAAAQHALGLSAIGSVIDPANCTVALRAAGVARLVCIGAPSLWWVANAPPPLLHACIEQFAAQIAQLQAPDQSVAATTNHRSPAGDT